MRLLRYAPSDSSTYIKYASGVLGRKPCIHIRLYRLVTNPCEKYGFKLNIVLKYVCNYEHGKQKSWHFQSSEIDKTLF